MDAVSDNNMHSAHRENVRIAQSTFTKGSHIQVSGNLTSGSIFNAR